MKPSQDQIKTAQELLERTNKDEGHTHVKERRYGDYEVCGGIVRRTAYRSRQAEVAP